MVLSGKVALVTGTRRIGALIAEKLAVEGVRVAIGWRSSREDAQALCARLGARAPACMVQGDVAVEADAERMVQRAADELGGLHFLVNLASRFDRTPLETLNGAQWDRGMAEARGAYLMSLYASRRMRQNPGPCRGQIVLFSDWAATGDAPYRHHLPYLTAKAAIDFMTRGFALELAADGIGVNAIAPGPTMKPPDLDDEVWKRVMHYTPLGRESSAEEIAQMVMTLLRSETITGETIRIDAGRHIAGMGSGWKNE